MCYVYCVANGLDYQVYCKGGVILLQHCISSSSSHIFHERLISCNITKLNLSIYSTYFKYFPWKIGFPLTNACCRVCERYQYWKNACDQQIAVCVRYISIGRMHVTNMLQGVWDISVLEGCIWPTSKGLQVGLSVNYWRGVECDYKQYVNII